MFHAPQCNYSYRQIANYSFPHSCNSSYMELSDFLMQLRLHRNLSQNDVARAVEVSRPAVTKWESGQTSNLKLDNLQALCRLYGMTTDELLSCDPALIDRPASYRLTPHKPPIQISEPIYAPAPIPTARDRRIAEIVEHLQRTDDTGLAIVLDKARDIAKEYPVRAKQTAS